METETCRSSSQWFPGLLFDIYSYEKQSLETLEEVHSQKSEQEAPGIVSTAFVLGGDF